MDYQTVNVQIEQAICYLQLYRPKANNTINDQMIEECHHVLDCYEKSINVVVIEGLPDVFCFGADFQELHDTMASGQIRERNPERLYDLWLRLATGPFITISHVRGRVNAGGIGFVAASDIVLAESNAQFSLSELLFGGFPCSSTSLSNSSNRCCKSQLFDDHDKDLYGSAGRCMGGIS